MRTADQLPSADAQADWNGAALEPRQFPVTVHDATHVFFDELTAYTSWLPNVTCDDSGLARALH
jgi:hypothetical protein